MRRLWILALAASGCRGILGIDPPTRVLDATDDADPTCERWGPADLEPCKLPAQDALALRAGHYTYDTSTGTLSDATGTLRTSDLTVTQSDDSVVAVLSIASLVIDRDASLSVIGRKPLVIVSSSTIAIDGAIDAGSHVGINAGNEARHIAETLTFGPGADEACAANTGKDGAEAPTTGGSGGGGGGGFQGKGGDGGTGGIGGTGGGTGQGGLGGVTVAATVLRGGCRGGDSGNAGLGAQTPVPQSLRAFGGAGGGAVRLVAREAITVAGSISAGGAGGAGAPMASLCGGGGGGSGGHVVLEAPAVTVQGAIAANGGGGGGGGGPGDFGHEGADGRADGQAASGGAPGSCGKTGGVGAASGDVDGAAGVNGSCGAGGGGGAAGVIVIVSPGFTRGPSPTFSPPAILP